MKTKEFIKRVEELGYRINKNGNEIVIMRYGFVVARTYTNKIYVINCFGFVNIGLGSESKLFDLIFEYAKTPIDERKEEKKIYLRHRYFRFHNGSRKYLAIDLVKDKPDLCSKITYRWVKNRFTEKEIEEIKEKYNTDLKDFEPEEVKE